MSHIVGAGLAAANSVSPSRLLKLTRRMSISGIGVGKLFQMADTLTNNKPPPANAHITRGVTRPGTGVGGGLKLS